MIIKTKNAVKMIINGENATVIYLRGLLDKVVEKLKSKLGITDPIGYDELIDKIDEIESPSDYFVSEIRMSYDDTMMGRTAPTVSVKKYPPVLVYPQQVESGWDPETGMPIFDYGFNRTFGDCSELQDVSNVTFVADEATESSYLFSNCYKLEKLPNLQFCNSMQTTNSTFSGCRVLTLDEIISSGFNVGNSTTLYGCFQNMLALNGEIDFSFLHSNVNGVNLGYAFSGCPHVTKIKNINIIPNYLANTFYNCSGLTEAPVFEMDLVTATSSMYYNCSALKTVSIGDMNKNTSMNSMFYYCTSLESVSLGKTPLVSNIISMFYGCNKLNQIGEFDGDKITSITNAFYNCTRLTDFAGIRNYGKGFSSSASTNYSNYKFVLSYSNNLTVDSMLSILNNLYDLRLKKSTYNMQTIQLGSVNLSRLRADSRGATAITNANAKRWTVS